MSAGDPFARAEADACPARERDIGAAGGAYTVEDVAALGELVKLEPPAVAICVAVRECAPAPRFSVVDHVPSAATTSVAFSVLPS